MKKNKEEMKSKLKVSLRILPFGNIIYETAGLEQPTQEKEFEMPKYVEHLTTNIQKVEIRYGDDGPYLVPKTTAYVGNLF